MSPLTSHLFTWSLVALPFVVGWLIHRWTVKRDTFVPQVWFGRDLIERIEAQQRHPSSRSWREARP